MITVNYFCRYDTFWYFENGLLNILKKLSSVKYVLWPLGIKYAQSEQVENSSKVEIDIEYCMNEESVKLTWQQFQFFDKMMLLVVVIREWLQRRLIWVWKVFCDG